MTKVAAFLATSPAGLRLSVRIRPLVFAKHHSIWTSLGSPTYGGGPFERIGLATSVPLLTGFLTVCIAELVVGGILRGGQPANLWLALALLPFELFFWIGFDLPFGYIVGLARTVLVIIAMRG